jgi:hypothetical protein
MLNKKEFIQLLEQEVEDFIQTQAEKVVKFEDDPMAYILQKYPSLQGTLEDLMTSSFEDYITGIYVMAPKPTTFKVLLHNGQQFYLIYARDSYIAKISGKKYYLLNLGEEEYAIKAIADLLTMGKPPGSQGPDAEEENTTNAGEEASAEEVPAEGGDEGGEEELAETKEKVEKPVKKSILKFKILKEGEEKKKSPLKFRIIKEAEVENFANTKKAVAKIEKEVGSKYNVQALKSRPNRLSAPGQKDPQVFIDIIKDVFGPDTEITVLGPRKGGNPSGKFNMYQFDAGELGQVNILGSYSAPGGDGKENEDIFINELSSLLEQVEGGAKVIIKSPEYTEVYDNVTKVMDSSKEAASDGEKSDVRLKSGTKTVANISLKKDGGFRWASVASYPKAKPFIKAFEEKALAGDIPVTLKPNPDAPGKYLMYNTETGDRVTKVLVPDFIEGDTERGDFVFGPEEPKVVVVGRTWKDEDFELNGNTITIQASHIYKEVSDVKGGDIDPVFVIAQHENKPIGLDYRIFPLKNGKYGPTAKGITLSYKDIVS